MFTGTNFPDSFNCPNNSIINTMKSADFFFSFLYFSKSKSNPLRKWFYKMFVEKYPEMAENISDPKHLEPEFQEIINLTG